MQKIFRSHFTSENVSRGTEQRHSSYRIFCHQSSESGARWRNFSWLFPQVEQTWTEFEIFRFSIRSGSKRDESNNRKSIIWQIRKCEHFVIKVLIQRMFYWWAKNHRKWNRKYFSKLHFHFPTRMSFCLISIINLFEDQMQLCNAFSIPLDPFIKCWKWAEWNQHRIVCG